MSVILKDSFRRKDLFDLFKIKHNPDDVSTMEDVCNANNVDPALFLYICNIYTYDDYQLEDNITGVFPIASAIEYVIRSQDYFSDIIMVYIKEELAEINSLRNDRIFAQLFAAALEAMDAHISNCRNVFALYLNQQPVTDQQVGHITELEDKAYQAIDIFIKYLMDMQVPEACKAKVDYIKCFLVFIRKDFDKSSMFTKAIFNRIGSH